MSLRETYTRRPPLVKGDDGLDHCGWCLNEHVLCNWHRAQLRHILDTLKTPHLLASAAADLRYVVNNRPKDGVDA